MRHKTEVLNFQEMHFGEIIKEFPGLYGFLTNDFCFDSNVKKNPARSLHPPESTFLCAALMKKLTF